MSILLNPKYERFAQLIMRGKSLAGAYREAGYHGNPEQSSSRGNRLRKHPKVLARITELMAMRDAVEVRAAEAAAKGLSITPHRVLHELALLGFSNMEDYTRAVGTVRVVDLSECPREKLAALQEITVDEVKTGGKGREEVRRIRLKLYDKRAALIDIGKELGMFIDRREIRKVDEFDRMTADQLREYLIKQLSGKAAPEDADGETKH